MESTVFATLGAAFNPANTPFFGASARVIDIDYEDVTPIKITDGTYTSIAQEIATKCDECLDSRTLDVEVESGEYFFFVKVAYSATPYQFRGGSYDGIRGREYEIVIEPVDKRYSIQEVHIYDNGGDAVLNHDFSVSKLEDILK